MCIRVPLPTYTGSFIIASDAEFRKESFQECQRSGENCLLIMIAVQQEIVYLCPNRGTGVFKVVSQKIVGGYVEGVGDQNQQLETEVFLTTLYSADVFIINSDDVSEILL